MIFFLLRLMDVTDKMSSQWSQTMEIYWASITVEVMDWCCLITMSLSRWPIRLIVDGLRWRYTIVTIILSFFLLWICVHITSDFFFTHLAKRYMLIFLVESTGMWLMENRSKSRSSKLNLCPEAEIVSFGSVLYGCNFLDILDVWDILDVLLGCLCVDVIVNIWMFIYACYVWMCKCAKCA